MRAFLLVRSGEDNTLVIANYFPANGQAYTSAFVFVNSIQSLKDVEYVIGKFFIEPDSVVRKGDHRVGTVFTERIVLFFISTGKILRINMDHR